MIELDDVRDAANRIAGHAHRTPIVTSRAIDAIVGGQLLFKCENLQRGGAFKFRGATNTILSMSSEERARGVFAYSSGNHAQAVALAASIVGVPATILMPQDTPSSKVEATRGYGAEVITYDRYTQDRQALGAQIAEERGLPLVRPYDDPRIQAGQGTAALEVFEDIDGIDIFLVPLGGGGLASGCSTVARALSPTTKVIGVEPTDGDDWARSLAAGERVRIDVPRTIADGLQADTPGELTFPVVQARVDEVVSVDDDDIIDAMRLLFERAKLVVEPSGAVGLAAVLAGRVDVVGKRVAIVLSGGNVSAARFAELLVG